MKTKKKGDDSDVCDADKASDRCITDLLESLNLNIPIVSEENTKNALKAYRSPYVSATKPPKDFMYWSVDPLDGTTNFINGSKDYAVLISLIINGDPILAVADLPAHDTTYFTTKMTPSYKQVGDNTPEVIHTKKHDHILNDVAFLNAEPEKNINFYTTICHKLKDFGIILPDTPIYDIDLPPAGLLAEGKIEAFVKVGRDGKTSGYPHDNGAWNLIVRNAGGGYLSTKNLCLGISFENARKKQHPHIGLGNRALRDKIFPAYQALKRG